MARVVLAVDISGTRDGKSWPPRGTEVDLPDTEAADMVRAGTAYELDDERVASTRGGVFTKLELAGAPTGRESTDGQPDTNLARAQAIGQGEQARPVARAAAEETGYVDENLIPGRAGGPTVGDGEDNPTASTRAADEAPKTVAPPAKTEGSKGNDTPETARASEADVETGTARGTVRRGGPGNGR
jgi:hypothetical protein